MRLSSGRRVAALAIGAVAVAAVVAMVVVQPWRAAPHTATAESDVIETAHVYDTDPAQTADDLTGYLYRPAKPAGDGETPVIVLIHGGGWLNGPDARYVAPIARELAGEGFAVWNVNYRRVGEGGGWPTTFTDLARAVDFTADLADDAAPEMDLERVTVVGHSAGGQLAAWTGGRHTLPAGAPGADPKIRPHAVVSLAGVLDMQMSLTKNDHVLRVLGGTPAQVPDRYAIVDPLERIDPSVPLTAVTGTADTIVPPREAAEYVDKHRSRGGVAALIEIPKVGHGEVIDVRGEWWPTIRSVIATSAHHGPRAFGAG